MSVQSQVNLDSTPFIIKSRDSVKDGSSILLQDAARGAVPLVPFTLMAQIAASGKWVPYTSLVAVDGSGIPSGIFLSSDIQGDITGAQLVAGDVVDIVILKSGADIDESKLVLENALTLDSVIADGIQTQTVREALAKIDIIPVTTYVDSQPQT